MIKKILATTLSAAMVFSFAATSFAADDLTFATGGEAGTYYAFGTVLAQHVSDKTDTSVTAIVGNGSQANIEDLDAGDVQLAFCQSDVMSYAYNGTNLFEEGGKIESFSVVSALYMEAVQIVTTNPDIKTVADLEGKNVSIGASGSGVYFNALDVLGAYDLTEDDIAKLREYIDHNCRVEGDLRRDIAFDIKRLIEKYHLCSRKTRKEKLKPLLRKEIKEFMNNSGISSKTRIKCYIQSLMPYIYGKIKFRNVTNETYWD